MADAVADQVKTFGKVSYGVKGTKSNKKVAYKKAALDKSLNAAFAADIKNTGDHALSLDTSMDSDWSPISEDPMDALMEEEAKTESMIEKVKKALTSDEWELVVAKSNGMKMSEIAEAAGYANHSAISKKFKMISKKATKATGFAFVA